MEHCYVYLIKSQKRLLVNPNTIKDEDYLQIFHVCSDDFDAAKHCCDCYCIGYITGSKLGAPINKAEEFE